MKLEGAVAALQRLLAPGSAPKENPR